MASNFQYSLKNEQDIEELFLNFSYKNANINKEKLRGICLAN